MQANPNISGVSPVPHLDSTQTNHVLQRDDEEFKRTMHGMIVFYIDDYSIVPKL